MPSVPIIDLGGANGEPSVDVVEQVADAATHFGFFQVVNHGMSAERIDAVWDVTRAFFAEPAEIKRQLNRSKENSRGYYDRELTKNKRDLKEVLDVAQSPFPDLPEDHPKNHHAIDGHNQWPSTVDGFQQVITQHLEGCLELSLFLLSAFSLGLNEQADALRAGFDPVHTSFLRLNHYPLDDLLSADEAASVTGLGDMALHHHTDAGALTLLLQDDVGGLQVGLDDGSQWVDVPPADGAIVVNTGDMMQVWSNDQYVAALHRVLPRTDQARFSLPYFFNPSYDTSYAPLPGSIADGDAPHYRSIRWGDFRQARADGDFADYGAEIQISDFRLNNA